MKWNMKWYIFKKIRCVLVDVFWTKTCFLVHVTRGKRKRKKEEKILIWTMVFKEKKASVKGLIGIPWAFSGLCSSNSSPSQRGAAGTKEALSLATSLQLAQTCIWSVMYHLGLETTVWFNPKDHRKISHIYLKLMG